MAKKLTIQVRDIEIKTIRQIVLIIFVLQILLVKKIL